jgi:hypothetical protein
MAVRYAAARGAGGSRIRPDIATMVADTYRRAAEAAERAPDGPAADVGSAEQRLNAAEEQQAEYTSEMASALQTITDAIEALRIKPAFSGNPARWSAFTGSLLELVADTDAHARQDAARQRVRGATGRAVRAVHPPVSARTGDAVTRAAARVRGIRDASGEAHAVQRRVADTMLLDTVTARHALDTLDAAARSDEVSRWSWLTASQYVDAVHSSMARRAAQLRGNDSGRNT